MIKFKIILTILLLIPINVRAENIVNIDCKKQESDYICDVTGKTNEYINAIDFKVLLPSYVESSEFKLNDNYFGSSENNWVSIVFDEKISGKFAIGTIKIKSKKVVNSEDIQIDDLKIVNENLEEIEINNNDKKSVNNTKLFSIIKKIIVCCVIIIIGMFIYFIMNRKGVIKK